MSIKPDTECSNIKLGITNLNRYIKFREVKMIFSNFQISCRHLDNAYIFGK